MSGGQKSRNSFNPKTARAGGGQKRENTSKHQQVISPFTKIPVIIKRTFGRGKEPLGITENVIERSQLRTVKVELPMQVFRQMNKLNIALIRHKNVN